MQLAPDAVQNVEGDLLTEGYKSRVPLFHNLFLSGVEKCSETASDGAGVSPEHRMRHKKSRPEGGSDC
jgi:hypothetical protein